MPKTLVTDGFGDEIEYIEPYSPHNILYGSQGWTDSLDDATIDLLTKTGAVELYRTISGVGFETRIFVSVKGKKP